MPIEIQVPQAAFSLDRTYVRRVMADVGDEIIGSTRSLIQSSTGSGRKYHGVVASAPGQAPVNRTGELAKSMRKSVRVNKSGISLLVRDYDKGALSLEAGAVGGGGRIKGIKNLRTSHKKGAKVGKPSTRRVLAPRPFLSVTAEGKAPDLEKRIGDALERGLEFQVQK